MLALSVVGQKFGHGVTGFCSRSHWTENQLPVLLCGLGFSPKLTGCRQHTFLVLALRQAPVSLLAGSQGCSQLPTSFVTWVPPSYTSNSSLSLDPSSPSNRDCFLLQSVKENSLHLKGLCDQVTFTQIIS